MFFGQRFISLLTSVWKSRFWWSLLIGIDWWDAVGCAQSAAEDGIGKDVEIVKSCYYFLCSFGACAWKIRDANYLVLLQFFFIHLKFVPENQNQWILQFTLLHALYCGCIIATVNCFCMLMRFLFHLVSVSLNSVIAVLDADFHSLPTAQHRQQYCHVYFCKLTPLACLVIYFCL